jgi:hypothetical protein
MTGKTKTLTILMHHLANAHFDYSGLFSDAQVEKVGNPKNKLKAERAVGCNENIFYNDFIKHYIRQLVSLAID